MGQGAPFGSSESRELPMAVVQMERGYRLLGGSSPPHGLKSTWSQVGVEDLRVDRLVLAWRLSDLGG